jgi:hypothetical protein
MQPFFYKGMQGAVDEKQDRNTPREKEKLCREREREPVGGKLGVFGDLGL